MRDELVGEVDEIWAEQVRHLPMRGAAPDPERAPLELVALIRTGVRDIEQVSFGRSNAARSGLASSGGFLRLDRTAYPDLALRKGDKVVALDREGAPVFEIMQVDDRSHLRLICDLGDAN
ncbi:hypothetical protein [Rubricella aquisinus]|uniref:hypothetical protein n=1 Tax=Rubricella aquisinus TaxID=2028108 RepID=UPI00160D4591|nr:hypothetical protein [Rubricella aquisinus]